MVEIPCTLRCDKCGSTESIVMEVKLAFPIDRLGPAVLTPLEDTISVGWQTVHNMLQCPRCNGVK